MLIKLIIIYYRYAFNSVDIHTGKEVWVVGKSQLVRQKRAHLVFINDAITEVFYDVLVFYHEIVFKQIVKKKNFFLLSNDKI